MTKLLKEPAIDDRSGRSRLPISILSDAGTPCAPAPKLRDVARSLQGDRFTQKTGHRAAICQRQRAETKWRRDASKKPPEARTRHVPDLNLDAAAVVRVMNQSGALAVRQGIEPVFGCCSGRAAQSGAQRHELAIQRLPAQMCADHGKRNVGKA